ncbi:MAG TPA: hypothetical protein VNO52_16590 [Methylomirabilota bacterium]|nr:hypothetical protein [Methylomirabilota bacterium]
MARSGAVAEGGSPTAFVRTLPEGSQWSSILTPWAGFLQAVIFQDGRFVGVGGRYSGPGWSLVLSSVDGWTWEQPSLQRGALSA